MRKNKTMQLCTAGVTDNPVSADDAANAIKTAGTEFQKCIASLEDVLDEPLKSKFADVKKQINTMLASLPETDKVPAAFASNDILQRLLGVLQTAQMMIANLNETAKTANQKLASTKASMPQEITDAINAKVKAGELFTKEAHDTAIKDTQATAATAARAAAMADVKRINERTQQLTTASIPVPDSSLLTGEDADFNAKKDAAQKRAGELAKFKLPADRVLTLAWNTDEAAYQTIVKDLSAVFDAAGKGAPANPFINPSNPGKDQTKPSQPAVC